ncbi:MAG: zinc ribbon domain-containing protein [archaeon]|nr:zinc ribbon domain-containing protein [archaeon]
MSQNRENYCYVLGLNPSRDYRPEDITRKIAEAKARWTHTKQDPSATEDERIRSAAYLKDIGEMEEVMSDRTKLENEFNEARSELKIKATLLLRNSVRLSNGSRVIDPDQVEKALENLGWGDVTREDLLNSSNFTFESMPEFVDVNTRNAYNKMASVGNPDPVALANELIGNPSLNLEIPALSDYSSSAMIRETYKKLNDMIRSLPPQRFEEQPDYLSLIRLVNHAISIDDRHTNELVSYCRCMRACRKAFSTLDLDVGHRFGKEFLDMLIAEACHDNPSDRKMCTNILEDYCIRKNYAADFYDEENSLASCPRCKMMYVDKEDVRFCPECGEPLKCRCPLCGRLQPAGGKVCVECGRDIGEAEEKAEEIARNVNSACLTCDIEKADRLMNDLSTSYPFYSTGTLPKRIDDLKKAISSIRADVRNYYSTGSYYRLCELVNENRIRYPLMGMEDVKERYEEARRRIDSAERICLEAATLSGDGRNDRYIQAAEICPDHPDARNNLKDRVPAGPRAGSIDVDRNGVTLRFILPEDRRGMKFQVYRAEGGFPRDSEDATVIGITEEDVYYDKSADPGKIYYYRVHSLRWGILSQDYAEYGPALIIKEVGDIDVVAEEDCIRIGFKNPRNCHRVRIWKKCGGTNAGEGDETELNFGGRYFEDHDVVNGETYYYLFVTEYNVCGEIKRSNGVIREVTVPRLPDPVDDLELEWNRDDGTYTVRWDMDGDVELYASPEKHALKNVVMRLRDVQDIVVPIEGRWGDKCCTFDPPFVGSMYLYPLTVFRDRAVVGKEYVIKVLEPVHGLVKNVEGDMCSLAFEWPNAAIGVKAVIDGKEKRVYRDEYNREGCLRFRLGRNLGTSVELRMIYEKDLGQSSEGLSTEEREDYSVPVSLTVYHNNYSTVQYSISAGRMSNDKRSYSVKVNLRSSAPTIPKVLVVYSDEKYPLKRFDGELVHESEDPLVFTDNLCEFSFTMTRDNIDLNRMKLFFEDAEAYNYLRFVHPANRRN